LVSWHPPSSRAASARSADAHQRSHEEGTASRDRREEEGDQIARRAIWSSCLQRTKDLLFVNQHTLSHGSWKEGEADRRGGRRDADSAQRLPSSQSPESLSMGRYTGPSCRQCRREGTKLFLKGTKCFTEKCPVERRPYAPGQHGQSTARRRKASEYSKQVREKQKIKRIYGLSEQQFRNTFRKVATMPGITGHNLLAALESRL